MKNTLLFALVAVFAGGCVMVPADQGPVDDGYQGGYYNNDGGYYNRGGDRDRRGYRNRDERRDRRHERDREERRFRPGQPMAQPMRPAPARGFMRPGGGKVLPPGVTRAAPSRGPLSREVVVPPQQRMRPGAPAARQPERRFERRDERRHERRDERRQERDRRGD